MSDGNLNLAHLSKLFVNEDLAREFIEKKLWPNGPVCPHCESKKAYKLTAKPDSKKPVRAGVYKCKECRKQFTVRIGTLFEDSHIPFSKWLMAVHLMISSKKGISSLQISRELGITIKSAWFVTHRIRKAMRGCFGPGPLRDVVEADETYVGGKPRFRAVRGVNKSGRGTKKTPVAVLVERDGQARVAPVESVTAKKLKDNILINVHPSAKIVTDAFPSYGGIGDDFDGGHALVNHGTREYVNIDGEHTNTVKRDSKPGPDAKLHTLHPFTFGQVLASVLKAKPPARRPKTKRKPTSK